MAEFTRPVPAIPDRDLVRFYKEVATLLDEQSFSLHIAGNAGATNFNLRPESQSERQKAISESPRFTVFNGHIHKNGLSINFSRDFNNTPSPQWDRITLSNNQNNPNTISDDVIDKINVLISETFLEPTSNNTLLLPTPKAFEEAVRSHEEILRRLQSTALQITEELVRARLALEGEYSSRLSGLETEYQEKAQKLSDQISAKEDDIHSREEELDERKKALDDRDHIHARRHLREQITGNIADRLKSAIVPPRTSFLGWMVLSIALGGAYFLGTLSYLSLNEYSEIIKQGASAKTAGQMPNDIAAIALANAPSTWFLLGRGFLTGFGAVGFIVYALAWLKNIYNSNVRSHNELERYAFDLNRASWAVETMMEATASKTEIPDALVMGISRNLFGGSHTPSNEGAGNEAVASLLRASVGAKIGPNGAEFQLNGRGANKIADKLDT